MLARRRPSNQSTNQSTFVRLSVLTISSNCLTYGGSYICPALVSHPNLARLHWSTDTWSNLLVAFVRNWLFPHYRNSCISISSSEKSTTVIWHTSCSAGVCDRPPLGLEGSSPGSWPGAHCGREESVFVVLFECFDSIWSSTASLKEVRRGNWHARHVMIGSRLHRLRTLLAFS